jgi:hypothetical protein
VGETQMLQNECCSMSYNVLHNAEKVCSGLKLRFETKFNVVAQNVVAS